MDYLLFLLVPVSSLLALCFALFFYLRMKREDEGTERMRHIAAAVRKSAMSYLKQQYKIVGYVFLVLVLLFSFRHAGLGAYRQRRAHFPEQRA